tara:strand:+ start:305 stop:526 length:222 start_codon:yes stop_codon:yes gene_type:complete
MQKFRIDQILAAQLFRSLLILRQPQTAKNADLVQTHTKKIEAIRERLSMSQQIKVAKDVCDILFNSKKLIELA